MKKRKVMAMVMAGTMLLSMGIPGIRIRGGVDNRICRRRFST